MRNPNEDEDEDEFIVDFRLIAGIFFGLVVSFGALGATVLHGSDKAELTAGTNAWGGFPVAIVTCIPMVALIGYTHKSPGFNYTILGALTIITASSASTGYFIEKKRGMTTLPFEQQVEASLLGMVIAVFGYFLATRIIVPSITKSIKFCCLWNNRDNHQLPQYVGNPALEPAFQI